MFLKKKRNFVGPVFFLFSNSGLAVGRSDGAFNFEIKHSGENYSYSTTTIMMGGWAFGFIALVGHSCIVCYVSKQTHTYNFDFRTESSKGGIKKIFGHISSFLRFHV